MKYRNEIPKKLAFYSLSSYLVHTYNIKNVKGIVTSTFERGKSCNAL